MPDYLQLTDEELISLAQQQNDKEAVVELDEEDKMLREKYLHTLKIEEKPDIDDCKLLLLSVGGQLREEILAALGEAAGILGDNGGDPDGRGPLLAPVDSFTAEELARAIQAGASVGVGYWFPYPPDLELEGAFCGYQHLQIGYTLSRRVAELAWSLSLGG